MKSLYSFILEGGAAGHMAHPYDYTDYTLRDIKGLIRNLFTGKIEDITEKLDGMNIVASVNTQGEVVFIRNKGDLNSPRGGMSLTDMATKWADRPHVLETYTSAGKTLEKVFNNIPLKFFNPDKNTRVACNCECVLAGKTNIIPYASAQVDVHNLFIYKFNGSEWGHVDTTRSGMDIIEKACEKVDGAQPTPQVLIKTNEESQKILVEYIKIIDKIFKESGCKEMDTIEKYKQNRFVEYCKDHYGWILDGPWEKLYNRWFNSDKSINIRELKKSYSDHVDDLVIIDKKEYKNICSWVGEPLDTFFAGLGNRIIKLCDGIINTGCEAQQIKILKNDIQDVIDFVQNEGSDAAKEKLSKQLDRLAKLGNEINATEGIVFKYKGKLQKITGSFSSLNQLVNIKYMDMK